jgi:Rrf2 family nitric oxide-sensitive transcriptional repressor
VVGEKTGGPARSLKERCIYNTSFLAQLFFATKGAASMTLSLFSDYSLRVLMYAALKADNFQLDEVTAAYGISRNHLAKVVHNLSKLGYLATRRGRGGGIELARPAEEVRIGALVRQTEGQAKLVECFDMATNTCRLAGNCNLKAALAEAMRAFYESLDRLTLRDLVKGPRRAEMSRILLPADA